MNKSYRNLCIVCGHSLDAHINEKDIWRCHSLGSDFSQCECVLRKNRAENKIEFYDLKKRVLELTKELKKEKGNEN
jgi:hypothetical protein